MVGNLAAERQAVLAFWHRCIDETLSPGQEATLEAGAYPWCPDLWQMVSELAGSQPRPQGSGGSREQQVGGLQGGC